MPLMELRAILPHHDGNDRAEAEAIAEALLNDELAHHDLTEHSIIVGELGHEYTGAMVEALLPDGFTPPTNGAVSYSRIHHQRLPDKSWNGWLDG